ncbi:hypothetical protein NDU88_004981 [Pleurodeles waltl]|uniref:Tetraspanin n=1 Tax=Pleurodeles waltl TaxID=8319 RepID=A0AAV7L2X5_PLEWA|nr:hypothetical protein NDU88_004981 [Pleurodeles waltl]
MPEASGCLFKGRARLVAVPETESSARKTGRKRGVCPGSAGASPEGLVRFSTNIPGARTARTSGGGPAMADRPGGGCLRLLKTFCLLFWGSGSFLCYAGVSLFLTCRYFQYFFQDPYFILPSALAIAAAGVLFFTGLLGCCITTKDARCQQGTFMYFIVILFCLEASAAILGYIYSNRIDYELSSMEDVFMKYNGSSPDLNSRKVDQLQEKLECCGVHNYTDWSDVPWQPHSINGSVPESCCIKSYSNCTGDMSYPELLYQKGCQGTLHQKLQRFLKYIYWGSVGAIAVEILAALIDCVLMGRQSFQDYRILDSETFA